MTQDKIYRSITALSALFLLVGCDIGEVALVEPGSDSRGEPTGISLTLKLPIEDSSLAGTLDWKARGVPNAAVELVRLRKDGQMGERLSSRTNSTGSTTVDELRPGKYLITAFRELSQVEVDEVGGIAPSLRALTAGTQASAVSGAIPDIELMAKRNRMQGLVISEVSATSPAIGTPGYNGYDYYQYLEIYNNGDEVVYLDGMLLGKAFWLGTFDFDIRPCLQTRQGANDPDGVWTHWFQKFPGRGNDFPVQPGETVVVATDAVDHNAFFSGFINLSDADFEFRGSSDVDNAGVPDMLQVGLSEFFGGHGLQWNFNDIPFLAAPVEIDGLPRARIDPANDREWIRIPGSAVIDVFNATWDSSVGASFCNDRIHDNFDLLAKIVSMEDLRYEWSAQRRVLPSPESGHPRLLDSNNAAVDLIHRQRSPFKVPVPMSGAH